tara:strand:+ start:3247 stop:3525 length:279 start_codon:yes stop_codon:yes gene_type:complete
MSKVKSIENPEEKAVKHWQKTSEKWLVGKKIVACRYMSSEEMEDTMWNNRPICLLLDDGTWIIPQCDDEGNDGGALYVQNAVKDKAEVLPVI